MRSYTLALALTLALILVPATVGAQYTTSDLPSIVDASRNNSLRFDRDYRNRPFSGTLHFRAVKSSLNGYMIYFNEAFCSTKSKIVVDPMIDWQTGKFVFVTGIIRDIMRVPILGSLMMLDDCTFSDHSH
jgi:hypothetical protein